MISVRRRLRRLHSFTSVSKCRCCIYLLFLTAGVFLLFSYQKHVGLQMVVNDKTAEIFVQESDNSTTLKKCTSGLDWSDANPLLRDLLPSNPNAKTGHDENSVVSYSVHAFYYMWYNAPSPKVNPKKAHWKHWNHSPIPHWSPKLRQGFLGNKSHKPPWDIASTFYPALGPYRSADLEVMRIHLKMARFAGIGVLVVSWYPRGLSDPNGESVDDMILSLLNEAHKHQIKVCLHIEPYPHRSAESVRQDLVYATARGYTKHPAYYRMDASQNVPILGNGDRFGLPVFFVYDSYMVDNSGWVEILSPIGSNTIRGTPHNAYLVGLILDSGTCTDLGRAGFNAGYTYFVGRAVTPASEPTLWDSILSECEVAHVAFFPSLGPGYDDHTVRPWNSVTKINRFQGRHYVEMFSKVKNRPVAGWGITSFNEWHEGTQIESVCPTKSIHVQKAVYKDYTPYSPEFYLRITRLLVNSFYKMTFKPELFNSSSLALEIERLRELGLYP